MHVAIVGGHGKVAMLLTERLTTGGSTVASLIRNPDHAEDIRAVGGDPIVCDIEHASAADIGQAIRGAEAVVFAAGAGAGSGAQRKLTVDRDGAIKTLAAAQAAGAPRYVMISSVGAEAPPDGDDVFSVYLRAKAEADAALQDSDRDWTIVRPGSLTDGPGRGLVRIDTDPYHGEVARDDVAAVLDALLQAARARRLILYVNAGDESIERSLEALARG